MNSGAARGKWPGASPLWVDVQKLCNMCVLVMELLRITRQIHCTAAEQRATLIHRQYNRDWGTSYSRPPIDPYLTSPPVTKSWRHHRLWTSICGSETMEVTGILMTKCMRLPWKLSDFRRVCFNVQNKYVLADTHRYAAMWRGCSVGCRQGAPRCRPFLVCQWRQTVNCSPLSAPEPTTPSIFSVPSLHTKRIHGTTTTMNSCIHQQWQNSIHYCSTTHTRYTHPFNGPLSGTTQVGRYQKGKNQCGFYWSKREWVAVASAGPYASLHLAPGR